MQNNSEVKDDELYEYEYIFLPIILDESNSLSPKKLHKRMANDPSFFCEIIRVVYKPICKEEAKNLKSIAYRLLQSWRVVPGTKNDGSFNIKELDNWIDKVKKIFSDSKYLNNALSQIGRVLLYAPKNPCGLFIHFGVAHHLNAKDAQILREGYIVELKNSRGVYTVDPEAKEEFSLSNNYNEKANQMDENSFFYFSGALREIAKDYDREAKYIISRNSST